MFDKAKAVGAWLYKWVTVIVGVVIGGASAVFEILDMIAGIDITPILPAAYAARIVTAVAVAKALYSFYSARREKP